MGPLILLLFSVSLGEQINSCGRNVTGMTSYLNLEVDLPVKKIADVLLAPVPFPLRYRKILHGTEYEKLSHSLLDPNFSNWTLLENDWIQRDVTYTRLVEGNFLIKSTNVHEYQSAKYVERSLIMRKLARSEENLLNGFSVTVEYCVVAEQLWKSKIEVHTRIVFDSFFANMFSDDIKTASHVGFTTNYKALEYVLVNIQQKNDPYLFTISSSENNHRSLWEKQPTVITSTVQEHPAAAAIYFGTITGIIIATILIIFIVYKSHKYYYATRLEVRIGKDERRRQLRNSQKEKRFEEGFGLQYVEVISVAKETLAPVREEEEMEEVSLD